MCRCGTTGTFRAPSAAGEGRGRRPEEGRAGGPSSGPWVVSTAVTARSPGRAHSTVSLQGYPGDTGSLESPALCSEVSQKPTNGVPRATGTYSPSQHPLPDSTNDEPPAQRPPSRAHPVSHLKGEGRSQTGLGTTRGSSVTWARLTAHPPLAPAPEVPGSEPRAAGSRRGPAEGPFNRDRPHREVLVSGCGSLQASGSRMTFGSTPHSLGAPGGQGQSMTTVEGVEAPREAS